MNLLHSIRHIFCLPQENPGHRDVRGLLTFILIPGEGRNRSSRLFLAAAVVIPAVALLWTLTALADEALLRGPRKSVRASVEAKEPATGKQGIPEEIASASVLFYQHFLSHQWGQSCAYYPSCSNYALLAIRKHGALVGSIMTFDRLQHEADEAGTSPLILTGGQIKVYDPLENNDYWWYMTTPSKPASPAILK
jgi:hypothetical protein